MGEVVARISFARTCERAFSLALSNQVWEVT